MGVSGSQYHPTKGRIGAANVEAGAGGFTVNPTGNNPQPAFDPNLGAADPIAMALTAATTHTLVGAQTVQLTKGYNDFTTVANASDCAALPIMKPGQSCIVNNRGTHVMQLWPPATVAIDANAAGAAVSLTNGKACLYFQLTATQMISSIYAGNSA